MGGKGGRWGQRPWRVLLERETEELKKTYEMKRKKNVENKVEAVAIHKNIVTSSVAQRALFPKDTAKFQLRKLYTSCTNIFMTIE